MVVYIHFPKRLHGVVLNELSTGTTLPYHILSNYLFQLAIVSLDIDEILVRNYGANTFTVTYLPWAVERHTYLSKGFSLLHKIEICTRNYESKLGKTSRIK
jgi:hypothetical protein